MIPIKKLTYAFVFMFACAACSNESDPVANKANFTHIYDNNNFNTAYTPLDLRQTADGGFLILGRRTISVYTPNASYFSGIYILKVNEFGEFINEIEFESSHVSPAPQLLEMAGSYYVFCMTPNGTTELVKLDSEGNIEQVKQLGNSYPLAAAVDHSNFILLSYDQADLMSVISVVSASGAILASKEYSIGAGKDVEDPVMNHFTRMGWQYPFQVGKTLSGQYFFNGFYNYTFSFVFTDLAQDNPPVIQGQRENGGISQVAQIDNTKFAVSRFNFGDNYFIPMGTLNNSGISSSEDLGGNALPELVSNAPVKIIKHQLNGKNVIIYCSDTRNNQIGLFIYDQASGEFIGSHYLGFGNSFTASGIIGTADGGIAISGLTYVAGRLPRICLFKISASELSKSIQ